MLGLKKPRGFEWFWVGYSLFWGVWNFVAFAGDVKGGQYGAAFIDLLLLSFILVFSWFCVWDSQRSRARREKFNRDHEELMARIDKERKERNGRD